MNGAQRVTFKGGIRHIKIKLVARNQTHVLHKILNSSFNVQKCCKAVYFNYTQIIR